MNCHSLLSCGRLGRSLQHTSAIGNALHGAFSITRNGIPKQWLSG
jgi:hypothetical protein